MGLLEKIDSPRDLKRLSIDELNELAGEIRRYLIEVLSKNGGHVAPNLGAVELTLALHYVFDSPIDRLVWDVGHQAYVHKIITGRREAFRTIRQYGGISGFLKRDESPHDIFGAGHAGTALSAAMGIAIARDMKGEDWKVVAIVGDGALTAGMALEALNQIGQLKKDMIIILNDNKMSIDENVGALSNYFARLVTSPIYDKFKEDVWELLGKLPSRYLSLRAREVARKIKETLQHFAVPSILFEELGYRYVGPFDGHDIKLLIDNFNRVKNLKGPTIVHVLTVKGKGYEPAEKNPEYFHGLGPFDPETGKPLPKKDKRPRYTKVFGQTLLEYAKKDPKIVAITAAMPLGTGLNYIRDELPDQYIDVGIAEQHAVTLAGGLAVEGMKPFATIYSTFLQRAFDQIIHDIALQNLPVRFAIDRGGLVGEDGPTHHGVFDLSYLRMIPNMVVMAPRDAEQLRDMIRTAVEYNEGPIAFRYPRDKVPFEPDYSREPQLVPIGKGEVMKEGGDVLLLAIGAMVLPSLDAARALEQNGINMTVVDARFVKPLDEELILDLASSAKAIITVEENVVAGGFGAGVLELLARNRIRKPVLNIGLPDKFIEHGPRQKLLEIVGLTPEGIANSITEFLDAL